MFLSDSGAICGADLRLPGGLHQENSGNAKDHILRRPAVAAQPSAMPSQPVAASRPAAPVTSGATPKVSREEIAAIVDRFLANREPDSAPPPAPAASVPSDYSRSSGGNSGASRVSADAGSAASANGRKAAEFVSEDDVRRAIQKGEKIYVGPRTIITPSARDIGDPAEVFAKA